MKTKIVSKLPSINALLTRMRIIGGKIEKCEGEIPEEFWCDSCKRLMKKIESLKQKIEDAELDTLQPKAYEEMNKTELRVDQGGVDHSSLHQEYSTLTYKYRCTRCGRVWREKSRLGIYHDLSEDVERCVTCNGIVEEITSQPTPTYKYKCTQCNCVFVGNDGHLWPPLGVILTTDKKLRCGYCAGIVEEIKPKTQ